MGEGEERGEKIPTKQSLLIVHIIHTSPSFVQLRANATVWGITEREQP